MTVTELEDPVVQFIDQAGVLNADHSTPDRATLDPDQLLGLYRDMVLLRRIDAEATALQRHGELGLWAPLRGQEAAQIGSARALGPRDFAFSSYREHGVAYARGVDPVEMLKFWRGTAHLAWKPKDVGMYGYQIMIGAHALHATGYAMGIAKAGNVGQSDPAQNEAVIAYFGDGANSEGDVNEALIFASVFNAPVVFFCQNNHWAISEPLSRQTRVPLVRRAAGMGVPGVRVDGNDVLACHTVTSEALDRARAGGGPTYIEAVTYRVGPHTTADDPSRYRDPVELDRWLARDPIARLAALLRDQGDLTDDIEADLDAEAEALGERMRAGCHALPDPTLDEQFPAVYARIDPDLQQQRAEAAEYLAAVGKV
jgi:pyruvate dehydrogenase E1 component alpha subunit